ncbi:MAG TPA: glycosyltransferase family 2 protein [Verrucomicrobiae bacterium]|nr:glycosyltransferase family 2 protein [Verrucomicrobiae bacterium]
MQSKIITAIPVFNGEEFIALTLESLARQTLKPDRVVVLDNCSTDRTEEIVKNFSGFRCEFIRNEKNLGLFGNLNRCLDFAPGTEFLQLLHADDTLEPEFYEVMTKLLADCPGRGLAWALDARIDENGRHLSVSGKAEGGIEAISRDAFLQRKAELGNQAFCATLLKTAGQPVPVRFREDLPIMGDTMFWAAFGAHCEKIIHVRRALGNYRWHGSNETVFRAPTLQALVLDEWRTMETNEELRGKGWSLSRKLKLKGLFAVRSAIKSKRVRQNGDAKYSSEIAAAARGITGWPFWLAGKVLVEIRDLAIYKIGGRTRHPKNIYG